MAAPIIFDDTECTSEICQNKIKLLKAEIQQCDAQIEDFKSQYSQLLIENLKKDVILESLNSKIKDIRYHEFSNDFSESDLEMIRLIGNDQRDDPSFVRAALRSLYVGNLAVLKHKSMSGKSKDNSKSAITPEKRKIIENLFNRRIQLVESEEMVDTRRKKSVAKHIKTAIEYINKDNK